MRSPTDITSSENLEKYFKPASIKENRSLISFYQSELGTECALDLDIQILTSVEHFVRFRKLEGLIDLLGHSGLTKRQRFSILRYLLSDIPTLSTNRNLRHFEQTLASLIARGSSDCGSPLPEVRMVEHAREQGQALVICGLSAALISKPKSLEVQAAKRCVESEIIRCIESVAISPFSVASVSKLSNREWCFGLSFAFKEILDAIQNKSLLKRFLESLSFIQDQVDEVMRSGDLDAAPDLYPAVAILASLHAAENKEQEESPVIRTESRLIFSNMLQNITSLKANFDGGESETLGYSIKAIRRK